MVIGAIPPLGLQEIKFYSHYNLKYKGFEPLIKIKINLILLFLIILNIFIKLFLINLYPYWDMFQFKLIRYFFFNIIYKIKFICRQNFNLFFSKKKTEI